jgi:hypothetical protein
MTKRHRGRNLVAGPRGEPKERTQAIGGSRKKLTDYCRGRTNRASVARHKGNLFRMFGPREIVERRRNNRRLHEDDPPYRSDRVQGAWASGTRQRRYCTKNPERTGGPGRQQIRKGPRWQTAAISEKAGDNHNRYQREELRTAITSGKRRNTRKEFMWDFRMKIRKQIMGTSIRMRKMNDWTLWSDRPLRNGRTI